MSDPTTVEVFTAMLERRLRGTERRTDVVGEHVERRYDHRRRSTSTVMTFHGPAHFSADEYQLAAGMFVAAYGHHVVETVDTKGRT